MWWMLAAFATPDRLRLDRHLEMPPSSDPDEAQFIYAIGSKTHAKGGGTIGFAGKPGVWGFGLAGFLELEDLRESGFFPWQAYRANIGLRYALRIDDGPDRWFFDGGYFHESDHAAAVDPLADAFGIRPGYIPNATISTQEYLALRIGLQRRGAHWGRWIRGGTKVYTPNFVNLDQARRDLAFSIEGRLEYRFVPQFQIWTAGYAEVVFNRYDAELPLLFRRGPYRHWQLELGTRTGKIDLFTGLKGGNGRGVGFVIVTPLTFTLFGLRTHL